MSSPALRTKSMQPRWRKDDLYIYKICQDYKKDSSPRIPLHCMIDTISDGLEASKDLVELIPTDPFPARDLIIALGYVIKLGIIEPQVKQHTFDFATQTVNFVEDSITAYESTPILGLWSELAHEICLWACALLEDVQRKQIINGLAKNKELEEFENFLVKSKETLRMYLAHAGTTNSSKRVEAERWSAYSRLKEIMYDIRESKRRQEDQLKCAFFANGLDSHVVVNATYSSLEKRPCHEGTRVTELADIKEWLHSISSGSQNFLWLTGDPGCGKSAIAASLVEYCDTNGLFLAQFFIDRNYSRTTNPEACFLSIAFQLSAKSPTVKHAILDNMVHPTHVSFSSADQSAKLFVDTVAVAAKLDETGIVAVIIDGLDETDKDRLHETATIFSRLINAFSQYPNVKVIISSRTEEDIRNPFTQGINDAKVKHVHLHTKDSVGDVTLFLRQILEEIVEVNELKWEEWPRDDRLAALSARASGHFIWVMTSMRFLMVRCEEDGKECLDSALNEMTGTSVGGLRNLYAFILQSIQKNYGKGWEFEKFQQTFGAIAVLKEPLSLAGLGGLLSHGSEDTIVDFLQAVLVDRGCPIETFTVLRLHQCFLEFITDDGPSEVFSVDGRFHVDRAVAEVDVALRCLDLLIDTAGSNKFSISQESLLYATRFCRSHAGTVVEGTSGLVIRDCIKTVEEVQSLISTTQRKRFPIPWFSGRCGESLMFSPLMTVYQMPNDEKLSLTKKLLNSAPSCVFCLAFSPDNEQLVSGLQNGLLISWDVRTGKEIGKFEGHTDWVLTVTLSPSGDHVASGSRDKTIRLWNSKSRQLKYVIREHSDQVRSVAFSLDGNCLASGSFDKTVRLWDVHSGQSITSPFQHDDLVFDVAFTPDGNQISSRTGESFILWDKETSEQESRKSTADSAAIAPFGNIIAVISYGSISFLDRRSEYFSFHYEKSIKLGPSPSHSQFCITFSPDGKSIVFWNDCDGNPSFYIYILHSRIKIPLPSAPIISWFTLSPDGSSIAFSQDSEIHIWSIPRLILSALSPGGDIIACALSDGSVWLGIPKDLPVVSKQFEGKVGKVQHFAFPSDGTLLAAIDEDSLYLWDIATLRLRAKTSFANLPPITSVSFLRDQRTIASIHEGDSVNTWVIADGNLCRTASSSPSELVFDLPLTLDIDEENVRQVAGAQWFPAKNKDAGLWAYIDDSLVRARPDDTVTVIPLNVT